MSEDHYEDAVIAFLEDVWGEGFLSPGGPEEVARVLEGLDLSGKRVLDIGCGSGAITVLLARDHNAGHVVGIDVEDPVCEAARARVAAEGLEDRITIQKVTPGPFPFDPESFDVVFSKDSIIHIPDKDMLSADIMRVLRPGGVFAASDWLIGHDGEPSPEMAAYIKQEDLGFAMASPTTYEVALRNSGFEGIKLTNRNPWYAKVAEAEIELMENTDREGFLERHGQEMMDAQLTTWRMMNTVLKSGEHCPHHVRAVKPA